MAHIAARQAWRRHHRAAFVAWYGPVFWPYAYSDIFDYTFWPYGYDEAYWPYIYDDFFDGVFWGQAGPPDAYVPQEESYAYAAPSGERQRVSSAGVEQLCGDPGSGITAWPFADITKAVAPTPEQQGLLDDLKAATQKAADVFKASCPSDNAYPRTPPGRLRAMTARLLATLQAVQTVRPPLEKFYTSLSDEQKASFNDLGPKQGGGESADKAEAAQASASQPNDCKQPKPGLSNLPIDRIEKIVKPTSDQEDALSTLEDATDKAVGLLQAACPDEIPLTPVGRLDAMQARLQAMIDAAKAVEGPLDDFFASLDNEQKARFNRLGREVARAAGD